MTEVGRLALRVEGEWWNAYWAPRNDSMAGAVLLGSIKMNLAVHPEVEAAFTETMKTAYSIAVEDVLGERPTYTHHPAPEHERSGSA